MSALTTTVTTLPGELHWLFGDSFVRRIELERHRRELMWSQTIRKLYGRPNMANHWATRIRDYRDALVNPEEAVRKVVDELQVDCENFDAALFDSYAEIGAVPKLAALGFESFEVLVRPAGPNSPKTADLKAKRRGEDAALEIKNLRAHECVESYMEKLFYDFQLKGQDMSGLRLVVQHSFRGTINETEKQVLARIVKRIRDYPRNENNTVQLSDRAAARFRIEDGSGDAICSDGALFSEMIGSVSDFEGFFRKIVDDLQRAEKQLYSPVAEAVSVRVAVMRWDIPWFRTIVPSHLQRVAAEILQRALAELSRPIDLHVFSDHKFDLFSTLK
jgi:hypothetical protein